MYNLQKITKISQLSFKIYQT